MKGFWNDPDGLTTAELTILAVLPLYLFVGVKLALAFISNPQEEQWLINADFQDACAKAIAKAIKKYYNLEEEKPMAEPWKELTMQWAQDELGISSEHKPDEPSPKWFTIAIQTRAKEIRR